jgi:hypothetical protein
MFDAFRGCLLRVPSSVNAGRDDVRHSGDMAAWPNTVGMTVSRAMKAVATIPALDDEGAATAEAIGDGATYRHLGVVDEANWQSVVDDAECAPRCADDEVDEPSRVLHSRARWPRGRDGSPGGLDRLSRWAIVRAP